MKDRYRWTLFALVVVLVAGAAPALAQNPTFRIEGVVTDAQQAVLPGVSITITNVSTNLTRTVTTDERGRYVITALPPEGKYRLQAELNFTLRVSSVQETITVADTPPIVQTTTSEVKSTIDRMSFENLPIKERNYFRILTLDSNVVASRPG